MRFTEKDYLDWAEKLYVDADDMTDGSIVHIDTDSFIQSRAALGMLAVELAREARRQEAEQ